MSLIDDTMRSDNFLRLCWRLLLLLLQTQTADDVFNSICVPRDTFKSRTAPVCVLVGDVLWCIADEAITDSARGAGEAAARSHKYTPLRASICGPHPSRVASFLGNHSFVLRLLFLRRRRRLAPVPTGRARRGQVESAGAERGCCTLFVARIQLCRRRRRRRR